VREQDDARPLAWVTGAAGLIGNYVVQTAPAFAPGWRVIGWRRSQLDLTDFEAVARAFRQHPPRLIVHCAALSRSPVCQANPALAWKLNVEVTQRLAEIAAEIAFILFSSDLVFDGQKGSYVETDAVNPLSIYAETKVAAEQLVLPNRNHTVIRTSLNGGTSQAGDRGFNEELRQAWRAGQNTKLFEDEFRSPIPAEATARAVWELAVQNRPGLYHLAGSERLSRWQIGQLIAARWPELNPKLEACSLREYQGALRPPDSSLNCEKLQSILSFPLPGLSDWLAAHPGRVF
jgi:dTDP-4-dehydrorhamnose reductase